MNFLLFKSLSSKFTKYTGVLLFHLPEKNQLPANFFFSQQANQKQMFLCAFNAFLRAKLADRKATPTSLIGLRGGHSTRKRLAPNCPI
jgi:hypothetical protein